jgi:hypothetical protein
MYVQAGSYVRWISEFFPNFNTTVKYLALRVAHDGVHTGGELFYARDEK